MNLPLLPLQRLLPLLPATSAATNSTALLNVLAAAVAAAVTQGQLDCIHTTSIAIDGTAITHATTVTADQQHQSR